MSGGMDELRASLGQKIPQNDVGPSLSVQEAGTARIVFSPDWATFTGMLVNGEEETFAIYARLCQATPSSSMDLESSSSSGGLPVIEAEGASTSYDVSVVDGSTGTQFQLHNVELRSERAGGGVSLESEQLRFETEELLVGARAHVEMQTYLNPQLAATANKLHLGTMSINFQTALTPPPTPSSVIEEGGHVEDMDQDFLK